MKHWYALYTKASCEHQVMAAMQRRGIETFLPECEIQQARNKGKPAPLFPCYLFIKANLERVGLTDLKWTPGLRQIVSFGAQPLPVPEEAISLIIHKLAETKVAGERPNHPFRPGDTVRIVEGPLQDMLAVFEGPVIANKRVQVLLSYLGRVNRLRVDPSNLEKSQPGGATPESRRPRRTRGRGRYIKRIALQEL